jgi:uncharacterized protein (DUF885 family)
VTQPDPTPATSPASPHPVHDLADRFVEAYAAAAPMEATYAGVAGHDDRWGDLSPTGVAEREALLRRTRAELDALPPAADRWDQLGVRVLAEQVDLELAEHEQGEPFLDLAHLGSTVPTMREVLDAQDTASEEGREAVVRRLETYGEALIGWRETIAEGQRRGLVVAQRQVDSVAEQLRSAVADRGTLTRLARELARQHPELAGRLDRALATTGEVSEDVARWLEEVYRPTATERDGVGPERHERFVRRELRTTIEPAETSAWAWDRIGELWARAERTARELDPDASLPEVMHRLKVDPAFAAPSPEAFRDLMQARQEQALAALSGEHFEVPEAIRTVNVELAAPGAPLGAWYIGPSEDFSRPGSVWWSLGDKQVIPLYEEVSTAYHEGFPGHHLQVGIQVSLAEHLTRAHRLLIWNPGYGEGWALYAEQLMDELGELERPEYVLGYLTSCLLRAVRVVADLGLHLDLPIPSDAPLHPDGRWSYEVGVEALERLAFLDPAYARSEVTRYLGMPAQAISYALGQRRIVELREERRRREGAAFDLARFHADVLGSGPVGLDHLTELVLAPAHPPAPEPPSA